MAERVLKIAIVAGEESGDLLAADLIDNLKKKTKCKIELIGVGGHHLQKLGLKSFFDADDIALMGLGSVLKKIPRLLRHIFQLSHYIAREKPDILIIVDSPDFTHRIAKKVRKLAPNIAIVKYIAPSVWAWRPHRAKKMCDFIDHVLVILPFEERVMKELDGPPATYVGHRLLTHPFLKKIEKERQNLQNDHSFSKTVLVLPGSRRSEIRNLIPIFGSSLDILKTRHPDIHIILPTLPHLENEVRNLTKDWSFNFKIVLGDEEKWCAFSKARVALAASGTVSLELALANIPMVLGYKADFFSKIFLMPKIKIWSAALPNIISDQPIVPEYFNEFLRPGMLARQVEQLLNDGPSRQAQLNGFENICAIMKTHESAGEIASQAVLPYITNLK
ncbi:lipid-A-disaccharide synthase [Bartonella tamiae]|uniref:Lipid-A-disaccharide synthase n=1 Tax=Bartonella tamiae Th239 TaxID=1094558 RepID=J0ZJY8_9HYPH|nr:lipid-A-disaccharide synthase [Bartonella tamiae]EJF88638.1 lipid-A-disaccharide synthase [Bartonella tamiae Th239]EJF95112.1 lipid-A-disaccharide synthase [Bartonella tamiae Th307]